MVDAVVCWFTRALQPLNLVAYLVTEDLALWHQVIVLKRHQKRSHLTRWDRLFWVALSRLWPSWKSALEIVQPDTVVRWHKRGFEMFWHRRCRGGKPGRKPLHPAVKALAAKLCNANPLWGVPRIHGGLLKLGLEISERNVLELIRRHRPKRPS